MKNNAIDPSVTLSLHDLISPTAQGVSSRALIQTGGGGVTLFAFDEGQKISEHSAPVEALVLVQQGKIKLTISGEPVMAVPGSIVRMPPNEPHALEALEASRMVLVMLRGSLS